MAVTKDDFGLREGAIGDPLPDMAHGGRVVFREPVTMDFGDAIRALKAGKRVARAGWNGKGMWLGLVLGYDYNPDEGKATAYALGCQKLPWIGMKTADNCFVPWLASQTDMLADDWVVV